MYHSFINCLRQSCSVQCIKLLENDVHGYATSFSVLSHLLYSITLLQIKNSKISISAFNPVIMDIVIKYVPHLSILRSEVAIPLCYQVRSTSNTVYYY